MTEIAAAGPSVAALLAASPDGVLAYDRDLRVTAWNPAMERLSGLAAEAALGRYVRDVFPLPIDQGERALAEAALRGDGEISAEWELAAEGGRARWVEARYAPLRDEGGAVCGVMAVVRDVSDRRRAAAVAADPAGSDAEERFRRVADTAPVMIWMADAENRGTYFNRPWLAFTGRAPEEELGAGWVETIHPDDLERVVAYCGAHVARSEEFRMEFRMRRHDGEWRWVLDHGIPRLDADGRLLGYVGSCVDITDRRRAEDALRRSEERYRSLVDASTRMVWTTDARGMVVDMPFWRELTGQSVDEVREEGWASALHPDDHDAVVRRWWDAVEARAPYEAEYRLRLRDDSYRWFAARAVPVLEEDGSVREWVGVFDDIHDRRVAEQALRDSEERYRLATLATRDVVWEWDLATDQVRFGDAIRQVLGYDPEEVAPQAGWWYDHIHPEDRGRVITGVHEAIFRRERVWTAEYRHLRADGTWAQVEDRAFLLYGDDGRPIRMVGATQDVTERRRAEAAREDERQRLRRVLAQMPAAVSVHEGPELTFAALSDAMQRLIGGRAVLGRAAREAIPELAAQGHADRLEEVYHTGRPYAASGITARWDSDGDGVAEEHVVDYVYQPLVDNEGRVYGVVSHVADVTGRERTARELADARREAETRADEAARLAAELAANTVALERRVEESRRLAAGLRAANEGLREASAHAEEARRRVAVLAEASTRLAASLDYRETVQTVAALAVPTLADWCFVEVKEDDGAIRLIAVGHQDAAKVELAHETLRRYPIDPEAPHGTGYVLRTGKKEVILDVPPEVFEAVAQDEEHLEVLRSVGFRSIISIPLAAAGRTFGVLSLVQAESGRNFTHDEVSLAEELAHRAAVAIENARLYEEALAANRAKAGFLATMSHELRTPLNAMIGYVDLLLLGIPERIPVAAQGQVERIRLASRHLLSIIEEILSFSRIEAGRETVEAEEVDLATLVREVSAIIEPLASEKSLLFHVPVDPAPARLVTDPRKLRQILVNLLGNAVKFTPRGAVGFAVERGEGEVRLRVSDTGIGIAPELHESIFEPFRQVDDAKTRTVSGTGLGLTVSRELARLLGGDVTVESTPGAGSVFTVTLPD